MRAVIHPATVPKNGSQKAVASGTASLKRPIAENERTNSWRGLFRRSTSLIYSAIFHTLLIVLLAFLAVRDRVPGKSMLSFDSGPSDTTSENIQFELAKVQTIAPEAQAESTVAVALSQDTIARSGGAESPTSAEALIISTLGIAIKSPTLDNYQSFVSAFAPHAGMFATGSIEGRSLENRTRLALSRGGSASSERAVEAALVWLAKHQYRDGGWSTSFIDGNCPCQGQCSHGGMNQLDMNRHAATGLALLSFLGAGYTHQEGKYKDEVYRGLMYLIDHIKNDPADLIDRRVPGQFSSPLSKHQMYEQGIATLAICEAYQMTHDPILKNTCQRAVDFISDAQSYDGSWGYYPKQSGDLSIVGWQMMSLKSAHSSELEVRNNRIIKIEDFLNTQQSEGGAKYGYRGARPTPSMTAIGLLMRLYRGHPKTDPRMFRGAAYIAENGPSRTDFYLNYYATQLLFQLNENHWPKWNTVLREHLIQSQSQLGHEAGSWYFDDDDRPPSNAIGGRLYCTALAAMTLEVYYRYMPIYLDVQEQPFKF